MKQISKLDAAQITRYTFDEDAQAQRVTIMPTEMTYQAESKVIIEADGWVSCIGFCHVCLYGEGTVYVSPDDGGEAATYEITLTSAQPTLLCARMISISGTGKLVIQST
jgi:hypothetical protein